MNQTATSFIPQTSLVSPSRAAQLALRICALSLACCVIFSVPVQGSDPWPHFADKNTEAPGGSDRSKAPCSVLCIPGIRVQTVGHQSPCPLLPQHHPNAHLLWGQAEDACSSPPFLHGVLPGPSLMWEPCLGSEFPLSSTLACGREDRTSTRRSPVRPLKKGLGSTSTSLP